ncbi:unnamed protein product [Linum trigynum]|uniref:Uncharacterized protein n=1 Tax=Linum trigynum TaxID=586398 RepID=A0AAV2FT48_9ROSI
MRKKRQVQGTLLVGGATSDRSSVTLPPSTRHWAHFTVSTKFGPATQSDSTDSQQWLVLRGPLPPTAHHFTFEPTSNKFAVRCPSSTHHARIFIIKENAYAFQGNRNSDPQLSKASSNQ